MHISHEYDLAQLQPVVSHFCERLAKEREVPQVDHGMAFEMLVGMWGKVKIPEDHSKLPTVFQKAKASPSYIKGLSADFGVLMKCAYLLQEEVGDREILLPVVPLSELFGKSVPHVCRIIHAAVGLKYLRVVNGNYSFVRGKAKTYRFIGNLPDVKAHEERKEQRT